MLIRPVSDLHSEFWKYYKTDKILEMVIPSLPTDKETVLIIAGDFGLAISKQWKEIFEITSKRFDTVICVAGNHFFYNSNCFDTLYKIKKEYAHRTDVRFLENESFLIKDFKKGESVVFIGSNLWTDFSKRNPLVMFGAQRMMNDFIKIKKSDNTVLTPEETVDLFDVSKKFIFNAISKCNCDDKVVVVTHHGCSPLSISNHYKYDDLNPAYVTDLTNDIMDNGPDLWIHGHIHDSADYMIGKTRVIVNPYGYKDHNENPNYQKDLVIEI